ncbi:flagellin [Komagataeibacter sp. FNDCR2]|uniref:flagellin n=1 Tax=Komagataeibacter sp. FNDCR2 TaxID=2878682 RepID=UPI001E3C5A87|nr:flagellin [Komagataeibacter sp. FNDCR2]MCE2576792.1 flagellin [Komagataeibacter sp. FNDCR2]
MSLSINTNTSAMVALETLNATQTELSSTENAVSTGLKVSTAADNPAAFGIAAQMSGNIAGQGAVNDGLSFASQVVSSTTSAADQIISVLHKIQSAVTTLGDNQGSPTSIAGIGDEITNYLTQIDTIARNATTNGVNLLSGGTSDGLSITASSLNYVTGLQGDTATITGFNSLIKNDASVKVAGAGGTTMTDALGLSQSGTAGQNPTSNIFTGSAGSSTISSTFNTSGTVNVSAMISQVQQAITAMTDVTDRLGANTQLLSSMSSYGATVSDNLTAGVGALTDADMAAESAKLTSLQTKQSLAIKSLTIANGQSQNILSLFQG